MGGSNGRNQKSARGDLICNYLKWLPGIIRGASIVAVRTMQDVILPFLLICFLLVIAAHAGWLPYMRARHDLLIITDLKSDNFN